MDKKFVDGMERYRLLWGGPVKCVMRTQRHGTLPFSKIYRLEDLPFELVALEEGEIVNPDHVKSASIVLSVGGDPLQLHISVMCNSLDIPCVYIVESTLATRLQIVRHSTPNIAKRYKSYLLSWMIERKRRRAYRIAAGLQVNGIPAHRGYQQYASNILPYFDSRLSAELFATGAELEASFERLDSGAPLRLIFSGRLEPIKGVDHLVPLSERLRDKGVAFELDIYGSGSLENNLKIQIAEKNLQENIRVHGEVDFETELVTITRTQSDIFVCCHRQSDPSCTYLEALACGAPVVGYLNEAFSGILDIAAVGWGIRMDDVNGLAEQIAYLDKNRNEIKDCTKNALEFARAHSFEATFQRRIDHLITTENNNDRKSGSIVSAMRREGP